jgi:hypothetical protein
VNAMDNLERRESGSEKSDNRAGKSILLGRKSVLMGLAASIGVALANATRPSPAMAVGTVKPIAATTPLYVPMWTPSTAYALGQPVISPNNDVVTANAAFRSSTTFTSDQAKWTVSSTFALRTDFTQLAAAVAALQAEIGTTPVSSPGTGMYSTLIYGPGLGFDTKANVVINNAESLAMRFKAGTSSAVTGVQWTQRTGTGYSGGNGGTTTVSIQTDDGTGKPSGTRLGQSTISPGNPGAQEKYIVQSLATSTLTAGTIYYIVFENPSATNYISSNCVYCYDNHTGPRQPKFNDAEFGVLLTTSYGGAWSSTVNSAAGYTPVVDIIYADGYHDGNAYYEAMIDYWGTISGTASMVRETFTVSGGNRSVSQAGVRMRRASGTGDLVLTLETAAGAYISSGTIPASSIPISAAGGDNGGSVWVTANFGAARTLTDGVAYNLRLSTAAGTTYTTHPIRNATENYYGFHSYDFTDGVPYQTVNGSTWTKMSNVSSYTAENFDLQFYLS